jgi:hypothetical protein
MKANSLLAAIALCYAYTATSQKLSNHVSFVETNHPDFLIFQPSDNHSSHSHFRLSAEEVMHDSIYIYELNDLKRWIETDKGVEIVYNSNKNITSLTHKVPEAQSWKNFRKYAYSYDPNYNQTNSLVLSWNGNSWINLAQKTTTYAADKVETTIQQQWNTTTNLWDNIGKILYTYDANGNELIEEFQPWDNITNTWTPARQFISSYGPDNRLKEKKGQAYENQLWVDVFRILFQYDVQGNVISLIDQEIDADKNWINSIKMESVFDSNNNLSLETLYQWNVSDSVWDAYNKSSDYLWNSTRDLLAYKTENIFNGSYVLSSNYKAIYNPLSQLTDEAILDWDDTGSDIISGDSSHYYIHDIASTVEDARSLKNSISIYPNPSNGRFTVVPENNQTVKTLEVYNIIGERILLQHSSNEVNISNAQTGIYFVKVDDGTEIYTKKITVQ